MPSAATGRPPTEISRSSSPGWLTARNIPPTTPAIAVTNWSVARTNRHVRALNQTGAARVLTVEPRTGVDVLAAVDRAASVSVPEKRASFDNTVTAAERSSKAAFDLDNNANLSWLQLKELDA